MFWCRMQRNKTQVIQAVTFLSPSWRSLSHWKCHLIIPKRSQRIARTITFHAGIRFGHVSMAVNSWRHTQQVDPQNPNGLFLHIVVLLEMKAHCNTRTTRTSNSNTDCLVIYGSPQWQETEVLPRILVDGPMGYPWYLPSNLDVPLWFLQILGLPEAI